MVLFRLAVMFGMLFVEAPPFALTWESLLSSLMPAGTGGLAAVGCEDTEYDGPPERPESPGEMLNDGPESDRVLIAMFGKEATCVGL